MVGMAFAGGLALGALRSKERREDEEFELAKTTAAKAPDKNKAIADYAKIGGDMSKITPDISYKEVLGFHSQRKREVKDIETQIENTKISQALIVNGGFSLRSSDKSSLHLFPAWSVYQRERGIKPDEATIDQNMGILPGMLSKIDNVYRRDKGLSNADILGSLTHYLDAAEKTTIGTTLTYGMNAEQFASQALPFISENKDLQKDVVALLKNYAFFNDSKAPVAKGVTMSQTSNTVLSDEKEVPAATANLEAQQSHTMAVSPFKHPIMGMTDGEWGEMQKKHHDMIPFFAAFDPKNANNPENIDSDGQYGIKSMVNSAYRGLQSSGNRRFQDFFSQWYNPNNSASQFTEDASPVKLLTMLWRKTKGNRIKGYVRKVPGRNFSIQGTVTTYPSKPAIKQEEIGRKNITKQTGSIASALTTLNSIKRLARTQGIIQGVSDIDKLSIDHLSRVFIGLFDDLPKHKFVTDASGNRVMSRATLHNTLMTAIAEGRLHPDNLRAFEERGSAVVSQAPSTVAQKLRNAWTAVMGIMDTFDAYSSSHVSMYRKEFNHEISVAEDKFNKSAWAGKNTFRGLIQTEQDTLEKNLAFIRDDFKANDRVTKAAMLARAQAQMSFLKISLAYQYAAISQGGEGSARTISDNDFAKHFAALFGSQGKEFIAVVNEIRDGINTQLAVSEEVLNQIGTGDVSKLNPIYLRAGVEMNEQKGIVRDKVREDEAAVNNEPPPSKGTGIASPLISKWHPKIEESFGRIDDRTVDVKTFHKKSDQGRSVKFKFGPGLDKDEALEGFYSVLGRRYLPAMKSKIQQIGKSKGIALNEPEVILGSLTAAQTVDLFFNYDIINNKDSSGLRNMNPFDFLDVMSSDTTTKFMNTYNMESNRHNLGKIIDAWHERELFAKMRTKEFQKKADDQTDSENEALETLISILANHLAKIEVWSKIPLPNLRTNIVRGQD